MTLNGKRIVVLGGTSGIGLAVAQAAAGEGAAVVVASSSQARVDEALKALPGGAEGHVVDLLDERAIQAFFETVGEIDHLVFTAGESLKLGLLAQTDTAAARRFFDLRYWGAFSAAKHGAGRLRPGGSIVFTSGLAASKPHPGWAVASSICSAMEGLTRALAVELAPLRVNIVSPGVVRTPLWAGMTEDDREALYQHQAQTLLVGHVGEAAEIAEAYLYLMRQTYGTGQVLVLDGGALLV
jgi:NAD(P)-dependent dehydrogenase (short-subunit alcohol dehydrogenase family)